MRFWALPLLALALVGAHGPKHPVATKPDPATESEHIVGPGETLGGIAVRAKVPRILIAEANRLDKPYHVHVGQRLMIPRTRHHVVKPGETGFGIAIDYGVPFSAIAVANGLKPKAKVRIGQELLIPTVIAPPPQEDDEAPALKPNPAPASRFGWPLHGDILLGFTARSAKHSHDGIDIAADEGTAVRATAAGKVLFAAVEPRKYGNLVVIDHGGGWHSAYAHLKRVTVHLGDKVRAGERVGLAGHTGRATTDELHFELRRGNRPVDPVKQLPVAD